MFDNYTSSLKIYKETENLNNIIESFSKMRERRSNITPELEACISKILTDNNLILISKTGTYEVSDLNDSLQQKHGTRDKVINVRSKSSGLTRDQIINNFLLYAKDSGIQTTRNLNFVTVSMYNENFILRFREEPNKMSRYQIGSLYERATCYAINNYSSLDFSSEEELTLQLIDAGFDMSSLDSFFRNTIFIVSQIIYKYYHSSSSNLACEHSKDKDGIVSRIVKKFKEVKADNGKSNKFDIIFSRYESWNKADLWVYPESEKEDIYNFIDNFDINQEDALDAFNSFFRERLMHRTLAGISLKKLDNVSLNSKMRNVNVSDNEYSSEKKDTFIRISGLDPYYLHIETEWAPKGYDYRSSRLSTANTCSFNYRLNMSQMGWVGYKKYMSWPEFGNCFKTDFFKKKVIPGALSDEEIRILSNSVIKKGSLFNREVVDYCKKIYENPNEIISLYISNKKIKCQLLYMCYVFAIMSPEQRDSVCTKIMYYTKGNYHGQGPYAYVNSK